MYTPYPCFICDKQIEYLSDRLIELCDGVEILIQGGYGSKHDLTQYRAYICDECLDQKFNQGKISFLIDISDPTVQIEKNINE